MKNLFIIGSGAREHAIIDTLIRTSNISKIFVYPGNDGMLKDNIVQKSPVSYKNKDEFVSFCFKNNIDMVVIGPENPLVDGYVDYLLSKNIICFGPSQNAAQIEGSKLFSKKFMNENNILTPNYKLFSNYLTAFNYLNTIDINTIVIKQPGLASGKGVYLPNSFEEANNIVKNYFINNNNPLIIEERLIGEEISILGFCNGNDIFLMPQAQDYKKIYDNDIGDNTGGMGSYAPAFLLNEDELFNVKNDMLKIVKKLNYKGVLYSGLLKTNDNIYCLEYNCRFGDPEAQVILTLLDCDLYDIFYNCINKNNITLKWKSGYASNVVLSHINYPLSKSSSNLKIDFKDKLNESIKLYWSNVEIIDDIYYTTGGRVVSMVSYNNTLYESIMNIYNNIYKISYDNIYYRRDIGYKELIKNPKKTLKIAILGSTRGSSALKLMDSIKNKELNAKIEVVLSNKKNAEILNFSRERGIASIYIPVSKNESYREYDIKIVNILKSFNIDVIFLVGYMKIVSDVLINQYKDFIFNIHPSLLPKYPGLMDLDVHTNVIKDKEIITGCTVHHVTEIVDGGDFLIQKQCFVNTTKPIELKKQVQNLESEALIDSIKILSNLPITYKSAGVDIDKGNNLVDYIKSLSISTKKYIGGFCSCYSHNNVEYAFATDGVGTKLDLAIQLNKFDTIGIDLVAMSINDIYAGGAIPLCFLDYIAIDKLDNTICKEIIKGINYGCEIANCKLVGGETAEMKNIYMVNKFDLAGFAFGVVKNKLPKLIYPGCFIYGIKSNGVHSNGFTLIRKLLNYSNYDLNELIKPTKIYTEVITLLSKYNNEILGISHITGGGHIDNLKRILDKNITFQINKWKFPEVFNWIQTESNMTYLEMMRTYNCGYGMLIISSTKLNENFLDFLGITIEGNTPIFV